MTNARQTTLDIFLAGVESAKPDNLIRSFVSLTGEQLKIKKHFIDLPAVNKLYVIGAGKASALMAKELESLLGNRINGGHVITKYGHAIPLEFIKVTEAGHPVPDENGLKGTSEILTFVRSAGKDDVILCLISGGGSALLTDVPEGCTLEDLKYLNDLLLKSGASINEMNCIRKHLSKVKGGLLSKAVWPARIYSLILSDVIGNPLDVIASGPTAPDPTTYTDALSILKYYDLEEKIPQQALQYLRDGLNRKHEETLKEDNPIFDKTNNLVIGSNRQALQVAKASAELKGYETEIVTDSLEGDIPDVVSFIVEMAKSAKQLISDEKICLLFGGEPTIKVTGDGKGGRNQHLALLAATMLKDLPGITILSGGTDGTDGSTDAAGAVVDMLTWHHAKDLELDIAKYIAEFDSYNFFKKEGGLIITGPTHTNVMDLIVALIE